MHHVEGLDLDWQACSLRSSDTAAGATSDLEFAATRCAVLWVRGLAPILKRVGRLATIVQIAGGCYVIYLGVMAWLRTEGNR